MIKNVITRKTGIIIIASMLVFTGLRAQSISLSLEESIALAGDSSLQAFRVKNLYMSNYWEYKAFRAGRLPFLTLNITPVEYNRRFTPRYDSDADMDVYREQQSLYSYGNLSISQNLDITGGTFTIDSELGHIKNFGESRQTQFSSIPIRIRYTQSLFGFNSFKWEKKIEPLKYEKAKRQYLYSKEEISETVIQYFFTLAVAQKEYDLATEYVQSSDTLYRIGQERYKIAAISQDNLLTLKLEAVNALNKMKNAGLSLERAMFAFASYLNLDKETKLNLHLPKRPNEIIIQSDMALQYAKENNPNYLAYHQELLEAEREVDRTKKSSNYSANLSASIGFNQVADNLKGAYKNPLQQDIASIGISVPLLDWGVRKGRANVAKNNLNVTKISVQQKVVSLEQEILMTVNDFNIQQDLIESAEEAMNLADMAYNITKERFIIGKADINTLTLSQGRQNSAQINYLSAIRNYWLSYYKLRRLTLFDFEKEETISSVFDEIINAGE